MNESGNTCTQSCESAKSARKKTSIVTLDMFSVDVISSFSTILGDLCQHYGPWLIQINPKGVLI